MKDYLSNALRAAVTAIAALIGMAGDGADAQVVTNLPIYINNTSGTTDFGNGPLELRVFQGSAQFWTSQGFGVGGTGGVSSTAVTLTATPSVVPSVSSIVTGPGITAGTLIASFNAATNVIGLPTAAIVPAGSAIAWGAACPAGGPGSTPVVLVQAGVSGDIPWYTQAHICAVAQFGVGATVFPFAIGAH